MHKLLLLTLLLTSPALATTKAKEPGQPSTNICQLRVKFLAPSATRTYVKRKDLTLPIDTVFWKVEILEVSRQEQCPALGQASIRVRGAMIDTSTEEEKITYIVGFKEPLANTLADLKVEHSKGTDTLTNIKFDEWILKEVISE